MISIFKTIDCSDDTESVLEKHMLQGQNSKEIMEVLDSFQLHKLKLNEV